MDYMANGTPASASVVVQDNDHLFNDILLQVNHDEDEFELVRQSVRRMQEDFYGDNSEQQLILNDNENAIESSNVYTESMLEQIDESAEDLADSLNKIKSLIQQKSKSDVIS